MIYRIDDMIPPATILAAQITGAGWRFEVGWDTCARTTVGADEIVRAS